MTSSGVVNVELALDDAARVPIEIHHVSSPTPAAASVPVATAAGVDGDPNLVVGISVHTKSVNTDAVKADITQIQALLSDRLASRQCVASSQIVWLQDGVYIPWKKPSTSYNVRQLVIFNWLRAMGAKRLRCQMHHQEWKTAGPGATYADAARVAGPATPQITSANLSGCEPCKIPTPNLRLPLSFFQDDSLVARPLLSLDLNGSADDKAKDQALRTRAHTMHYDQIDRLLGCGSFGDVYICASTVGPRAVKRLKIFREQGSTQAETSRTHCSVALAEVAVLERCASCPHIITLLDVCKCGQSICLIFEEWGCSLHHLKSTLNSGFCSGPNAGYHLRAVLHQSLQAVRFLHEIDVIHTDIKTPNVLVKWKDSIGCEPLHVRLADLGSCVVADPLRRPHIDAQTQSFRHEMRHITTFPCRAPEIVFCDKNFGTAIDLWALGITMFSLSDFHFTFECNPSPPETIKAAEQRLVAAWCSQLGTPSAEELLKLRAFPYCQDYDSPGVDSTMAASPVPRRVRALFGRNGSALLLRFLSWCAEGRGSAETALGATSFCPESLWLASPAPGESYTDPKTSAFTGVRHLWNVVQGEVSPEIMSRMFGNVATIAKIVKSTFNMTGAAASLKLSNNCSVSELEHATKYTIAGWLVKDAQNGKLNTLTISKRMPFPELRKWRNAMVQIANVEVIAYFWANLKACLASLEGDLGKSGEFLMKTHPNLWLWAVGEAHITHRHCTKPRTVKRRKGAAPKLPILEELHNDGAASGLHIGLTAGGKRKVRFLQEAVQPTTTKDVTQSVAKDVILSCYPGHVYAGGVTGARHQVIHDEFDEEEEALLDLPMGPCSLTFMLRSCIFPDRSRLMNTTPNPRNVWLCFTACARELISDERLRLPTVDEYLQAPAE